MPAAIKEALARIETLAEGLDPEQQAYALEALSELAERLEHDRKWDELLATPESQAFLEQLSANVNEAIARGEVEEGGWTR
jgi:hypothetical protein